ncbi:MAG: hypothetical protein CL764_07080 [Chloroflexi bacterium]|nr:hypothetical protein [Chloroflexota bacterium]|tara:strand:+ start:2482 stop:3513 length:1032 start_codon:yes stop_codon:yes gene_type:complete
MNFYSKISDWANLNSRGLFICTLIAVTSYLIQYFEIYFLSYNYIDSLIISLLIGLVLHNFLSISKISNNGAKFASKQLLEFSVMLLGASVNLTLIFQEGLSIISLVVFSVILCLFLTWLFSKYFLKLSSNISILIATGNSICGNSAVVAMAPVIKATSSEIAAAIGFSAIIGVLQVLLLPLLSLNGQISNFEYGIIAGISIYAVPQVVAASFAISTQSGIIATQVKLIRVLLLGPLLIFFGIIKKENKVKLDLKSITNFIPWFILGFLFLSILRTTNIIPESSSEIIQSISKFLFIIAMAGIGLTVNFKEVKKIGFKVILAVIFAVILLILIGLGGISIFDFN